MTTESARGSAARRQLLWGGLFTAIVSAVSAKSVSHAKEKAEAFGDVERLAAIEEIRQLKHRYFAAVDGKDWKTLRGLYTDDATFTSDVPKPGDPILKGPDDFIKFLSSPDRATKQSKHHGHNLLLTFTSPTDADGEWDYEAWTWQRREDGKLEDQALRHNWGKYIDRYRKTPAGWRISRMIGTLIHKG